MRIRRKEGKEERRIRRLEERKDLKEGRLENWKEGIKDDPIFVSVWSK